MKEREYKFSYSALYSFHREDMSRYHKYYFLLILISILPCFFWRLIYDEIETQGIYNEDGQAMGFFMFGMVAIFAVVIIYHIILIVMTTNFDWVWFVGFVFSFMWVWFVSWRSDSREPSYYYKSIYTELMQSPIFWLTIAALIALMIVPFYAWHKWRQFFGGDPRYDMKMQGERTAQSQGHRVAKVSAMLSKSSYEPESSTKKVSDIE